METNFEYLAKILKDDAIDTWTLREQEPIYESEHIIILDSDSTIGCQE